MVEKIYDLTIIGSGPAGLSAAVTARARNKSVLVIGNQEISVKLEKAHQIDNYLGIPGISGEELAKRFREHCLKAGAELVNEKVQNIYQQKDKFQLMTEQNNLYQTRTILLSTGVSSSQSLPMERELMGRGVSYCATCDGMFYRDKKVAVISYSPEGPEEANFLADICSQVYYIAGYRGLEKDLKEKIEVIAHPPKAIVGEEKVQGVDLGERIVEVEGVFIARESIPLEQLLPELVLEDKYIKVNRDMATNLNGVFAAGDCTGKPYQISKAVGEGQIAALSAAKYIEEKNKEWKGDI